MISYKDRTYCIYYKECIVGEGCPRALTPEVEKQAKEWWGSGNAPISIFANEPQCFEVIDKIIKKEID